MPAKKVKEDQAIVPNESDIITHVDESPDALKAQVELNAPSSDQEENSKPKKPRVIIPKKKITVVIDGGRSRVKILVIVDGVIITSFFIDSTICSVESPPFGEAGAFSMSKGKGEDKKDIVESWVCGSSAKLQNKPFISMTDGDNHKVLHFAELALGAIASYSRLFELSTGSSDKSRSLLIELVTLSLADPLKLKKNISTCKWIKVDGVKYSLSFSKTALNYPEGYGAALFGQSLGRMTHTFDIGDGTGCVSLYNNEGKIPKRVSFKPHGGAGTSTLNREFAEAIANAGDSSRLIKPSQLREILETSSYDVEQGKVIATDSTGRDIGSALEVAIKNWMQDSPLTFALETLRTAGRKHPIVLCGGGFEIPAVKHFITETLLQSKVPLDHIVCPPNPGLVSLSGMTKIYTQEQCPTSSELTTTSL
ncbi:hypothetical protein HW132_28295 [Brasilonema sp. CT11]|nr:hypothetical protein [Brasilonema sp. CT11]